MSNTNSAGIIPASEPPSSFAGNGSEPPLEPESTFIGPLCDPIGFSQHIGECWSDSILEAFLFADGFKDVVQPLLYNTFTNDRATTEYLESKYEESSVSQKRQLMNIAKRFKYHYDILKSMYASCNTIEDKQSCIKLFKEYVFRSKKKTSTCGFMTPRTQNKVEVKRQISENLGPAIATNIRNTFRGSLGINKGGHEQAGGTILDTIIYLNYMLNSFDLDSTYSIYLDDRTYLSLSKSDIIKDRLNQFAKIYSIYKTPDSSILIMHDLTHAIAIFKCNDIWYLYDNNHGIFKLRINIPDLLNILIEAKNKLKNPYFVYGYDKDVGPAFAVKSKAGPEIKELLYFYPMRYFLIGTNTDPQPQPQLERSGGYKKLRGRGSKRKTRKARKRSTH